MSYYSFFDGAIKIDKSIVAEHDSKIRTETIDKCIEIVSNADVDISPSRDIILKDLKRLKENNND